MIDGSKRGNIRETINAIPVRVGWARDWRRWTPYAAVAWSLVYAALGLYWAVSARSGPGFVSSVAGPMAGQFGPIVAWIIVIMEGLPAAVVGIFMLRGIRNLRPQFITAGALLAGILLLLMTDLTLLTTLVYVPYVLFRFLTSDNIGFYVQELAQSWWIIAHQLLCLIGGFFWLAATISYARWSTDDCLYSSRQDSRRGERVQAKPPAGAGSPCTRPW